MADRITYVGLDVHKDSIVVAVAAGGPARRGAGVRPDREHIDGAGPFAAQARRRRHEAAVLLRSGPCGYGIQRRLSTRGHECVVVAPSLIPKRAGDRVKTDRRDAAGLAKLHRAGELTAGMGSGCRTRGDARSGTGTARRGAQPAPGAPAALRVLAASWMPLWPGGLDQAASPVSAGLKFEQAVHHNRAGRLRCGGRGRRGAAQPADGADRGNAAGLDIGSRGGGIARQCGAWRWSMRRA